MRVEVIFCPACRHKLRIPDDLLGQPVQCPECRAMFVGPPPPPSAARTERLDRPEFEPDEPTPAGETYGTIVMAAGLLLVSVSLLGLFVSGLKIVMAFNPRMLQMATQNNPMGPMPANFDFRTAFVVMGVLFGVVSLVSLAGGFAMLRRRGYVLAVVGCLAAIVNIGDCCTFVSPLVGIPALILLLLPQVRASFR